MRLRHRPLVCDRKSKFKLIGRKNRKETEKFAEFQKNRQKTEKSAKYRFFGANRKIGNNEKSAENRKIDTNQINGHKIETSKKSAKHRLIGANRKIVIKPINQ